MHVERSRRRVQQTHPFDEGGDPRGPRAEYGAWKPGDARSGQRSIGETIDWAVCHVWPDGEKNHVAVPALGLAGRKPVPTGHEADDDGPGDLGTARSAIGAGYVRPLMNSRVGGWPAGHGELRGGGEAAVRLADGS